MPVALITTEDSRHLNEGTFDDTPLGASLRSQTNSRWTLDDSRDDITATISVDAHSSLHERAVEIVLHLFHSQPGLELLIADAIVAGLSQPRSAWSPAAVISQPHELDLLACRGHSPIHGIAGRIQAVTKPTAAPWHLPAPLVRRAKAPGSTAELDAAIGAFVAAQMPGSEAGFGPRAGTYVVKPVQNPPPTTVIIPTAGVLDHAGAPMVHRAITAVNSTKANTEIMLVVGNEYLGDPTDLLQFDRCRLIRRPPGPWNFSETINLGLLACQTEHVLLLNDDIKHIDTTWLHQMSGHLNDPSVGAVGALLLYPDRTVQHVGIIIDDAVPSHSFTGLSESELSAHGMDLARDTVAVTGACLLARRRDLLQVGGLNLDLPCSYNDVDLCLKLHRSGFRVVIEPSARLIHYESASRSLDIAEWEWSRFLGRWGTVVDPWYHPAHLLPNGPRDQPANAGHPAPSDTAFSTIPRCPEIQSRMPPS